MGTSFNMYVGTWSSFHSKRIRPPSTNHNMTWPTGRPLLDMDKLDQPAIMSGEVPGGTQKRSPGPVEGEEATAQVLADSGIHDHQSHVQNRKRALIAATLFAVCKNEDLVLGRA